MYGVERMAVTGEGRPSLVIMQSAFSSINLVQSEYFSQNFIVLSRKTQGCSFHQVLGTLNWKGIIALINDCITSEGVTIIFYVRICTYITVDEDACIAKWYSGPHH